MSELRFYYGTLEHNIDITNKVYQSFKVEHYIILPANDNVRAHLFSDPCFRTVKQIMISGLSNRIHVIDHETTLVLDTRTNQVINDVSLSRRLLVQTTMKPEDKAHALHSLITLQHGSMRDEFPEQCMALEFLTGTEKVLEIGGNIGRNSIVISSILNKDTNLVVLECSKSIANVLSKNRSLNRMQFHIENFHFQ